MMNTFQLYCKHISVASCLYTVVHVSYFLIFTDKMKSHQWWDISCYVPEKLKETRCIKWAGRIQWQAITMLYVHFISLANQPRILRVFTVPSSLFFPETCPESARLIKQDETITRRVILLPTMGCGQVVEAPVSLGSSRLPPHVLWVRDRDSLCGQ